MINKAEKFSNLHFFILMIGYITPFGHFVYIRLTYGYSGRDAWISLIFTTLLASAIIYLQFRLAARYPDHSLVENSIQAFGNWIGRFVGIIFICFFLLACSITLHIFTKFLNMLFPLTPSVVFIICILFAMAYVIHAGPEALSRTIQICLPVLMLLGLMVSILVINERDWRQILPIMEDGFFPVWHGSIIFLTMFAELIVFRMLIPNTNNPKKLPKQGLVFIVIALLMFLGPTTGPIMIFGEDFAKTTLYPTFEEIRYIQLFDFIERLDVLGIFLWVTGAFFHASILLFGAAQGLAEMVNAHNDNIFVLPVAFIIFGLEFSLKSYTPEKTYHFLVSAYSIITIIVGILLPLFIDMVIAVRHKWKPGWNGGKEV